MSVMSRQLKLLTRRCAYEQHTKTGTWRVFRPVVDKEKCNECGLCASYCPDAAISENLEIDLTYCKGCGICSNECPKKAIVMVREEK
jgi:pyruvate ferredoxin oxidoreductase delta subunit